MRSSPFPCTIETNANSTTNWFYDEEIFALGIIEMREHFGSLFQVLSYKTSLVGDVSSLGDVDPSSADKKIFWIERVITPDKRDNG